MYLLETKNAPQKPHTWQICKLVHVQMDVPLHCKCSLHINCALLLIQVKNNNKLPLLLPCYCHVCANKYAPKLTHMQISSSVDIRQLCQYMQIWDNYINMYTSCELTISYSVKGALIHMYSHHRHMPLNKYTCHSAHKKAKCTSSWYASTQVNQHNATYELTAPNHVTISTVHRWQQWCQLWWWWWWWWWWYWMMTTQHDRIIWVDQ